MNLTIRAKLFLTMMFSVMLAILGVYIGFQHYFTKGLLDYLDQGDQLAPKRMIELLEDHYAQKIQSHANNRKEHEQSIWQALADDTLRWQSLHRQAWDFRIRGFNKSAKKQSENDPENRKKSDSILNISPDVHSSYGSFVLYNFEREPLIGHHNNESVKQFKPKPIFYNNQAVGYLGYIKRTQLINDSELTFASNLRQSLLVLSLSALLITALLALALSYHLVKPIKALRRGTRELTSGNYANRVDIMSRDELAALSHDFNQLAQTLQRHEADRKQWMVDIAHELRTPLSVLRGEIEAIEDGIEPLSLESIRYLHHETLHLQRLIEDLYDLSMSDIGALSYKKDHENVIDILQMSIDRFKHKLTEAQLTLDSSAIKHKTVIAHVDYRRIQQLFDNLLGNSLRYTNSPGTIKITVAIKQETKQNVKQKSVIIEFDDTSPGPDDDSLQRLFDRLYRVEASRNRALGGAGVGLTICKNIVTAHDGTIDASHSVLGGLNITIMLPIEG